MSGSDFDPDRLRIDPATVEVWMGKANTGKPSLVRRTRKGKFLAGPIPLAWLKRAAQLPGKALAVGLALWFLKRCQNQTTVRLTRRTLERFGVARKPGYNGLQALERAGLVQVRRHVGKSPVVTLCRARQTGVEPAV
jgi:hypothetical protein